MGCIKSKKEEREERIEGIDNVHRTTKNFPLMGLKERNIMSNRILETFLKLVSGIKYLFFSLAF